MTVTPLMRTGAAAEATCGLVRRRRGVEIEVASTFDAFMQQAWADHASQPAAVASRLRKQTPAPKTADQLSALVRLVVHLCGEHLGAFDDGRWRLAALVTHPLADAAVRSALRVGAASLTLAQTGRADYTGFTLEEQVRTEAAAAAISLGRHQTERAMTLLRAARDRLSAMPSAGAAVHRPLAVACNNMTWELHDRGSARNANDTAAMLDVAAASRLHWAQAGTWLEIERGDYGLALCHVSAGLPEAALPFAAQCLAACTMNDAPAYEHFFAHEALARVHDARGDAISRASAITAAEAAFAKLAPDDQAACRSALTALHALAR